MLDSVWFPKQSVRLPQSHWVIANTTARDSAGMNGNWQLPKCITTGLFMDIAYLVLLISFPRNVPESLHLSMHCMSNPQYKGKMVWRTSNFCYWNTYTMCTERFVPSPWNFRTQHIDCVIDIHQTTTKLHHSDLIHFNVSHAGCVHIPGLV